nr:cytochrome c oxidase subunit 3 [Antarctophthirus microchir]
MTPFSSKGFHPFHLVSPSPWPLLTSLSVFFVVLGTLNFLVKGDSAFVALPLSGLFSLLLCVTQWWRDVVKEMLFLGTQSNSVLSSLNLGFSLFIVSEAVLFLSLFYCWVSMTLSPDTVYGLTYPPKGIILTSITLIPFANTVLLISSSLTATIAHQYLSNNELSVTVANSKCMGMLLRTIGLGIIFLILQFSEYNQSSMTMTDSTFGSLFYSITGLHGSHVLIGILFLSVNFWRMMGGHFTPSSHFGFVASVWYWHFVDFIWLIVLALVYVWPAYQLLS